MLKKIFGLTLIFLFFTVLTGAIYIERDAYNEIRNDVRKNTPKEAVGFLIGVIDTVNNDVFIKDVVPCKNVSPQPDETAMWSNECLLVVQNEHPTDYVLGEYHSHTTDLIRVIFGQPYAIPILSNRDKSRVLKNGILNSMPVHILMAYQMSGEIWTTGWIVLDSFLIESPVVFIVEGK